MERKNWWVLYTNGTQRWEHRSNDFSCATAGGYRHFLNWKFSNSSTQRGLPGSPNFWEEKMVDIDKTKTLPIWVGFMQQEGSAWSSFFILSAQYSEITTQNVRADLHAAVRTTVSSGKTAPFCYSDLKTIQIKIISCNFFSKCKKQLFI